LPETERIDIIIFTVVLYSAPFKVIFWGALPAQPQGLKAWGKNRADWPTGVRYSAIGRPFQAIGPAAENVQHCQIKVRVRGTSNSACAEERN